MNMKHTMEEHEARLKTFYDTHGKVPCANDLGSATLNALLKKYGSWNGATIGVLGKTAIRHKWNDDEILLLLKSIYLKYKRFPSWKEIKSIKKSLTELIHLRFGGLDAALEKAIGTSPRMEALLALGELTSGTQDSAFTREIWAVIMKKNISITVIAVGMALTRERQSGMVTSNIFGVSTLWSLTPAGKLFLKSIRTKKAR